MEDIKFSDTVPSPCVELFIELLLREASQVDGIDGEEGSEEVVILPNHDRVPPQGEAGMRASEAESGRRN